MSRMWFEVVPIERVRTKMNHLKYSNTRSSQNGGIRRKRYSKHVPLKFTICTWTYDYPYLDTWSIGCCPPNSSLISAPHVRIDGRVEPSRSIALNMATGNVRAKCFTSWILDAVFAIFDFTSLQDRSSDTRVLSLNFEWHPAPYFSLKVNSLHQQSTVTEMADFAYHINIL